MKILKIFGIVVGIHIFALILIFANPGCSSTTKPPPAATETVAKAEPASSAINVPSINPAPASSAQAPVTLNLDAPASSSSSGGMRAMPTRPGSPVAGVLVNEPVTDVTPATTYTVVSGDNLSKIAKKTHVTIAELAAANNLKTNATLRLGQKLLIPGKPASASVAASSTPGGSVAPAMKTPEPAVARTSGEVLKHTVKSGETLGAIARKYEVKVADIAVANNISDPAKIRPGQELIIPGWDSKGTAPSKTGKSGKTTGSSQKSGDTKTTTAELPPATEPSPPPAIPVNPIEDSPIKPAPRP